jgi:hypothetical protein
MLERELPGPVPGLAAGDMTGPAAALRRDGFVLLPAEAARGLLGPTGAADPAAWAEFAASWNDMPLDQYMADGGRYRRRRHAVFAARAGQPGLPRQPAAPHYQAVRHNALNGGIARHFDPVPEAISQGATFQGLLAWCRALFDSLTPDADWHVEAHQFRIEALPGAPGLPTPEGVHRDGVDWVMVLLVTRNNVASGVTSIQTPEGQSLGSFTLTRPFDAVLVDDHRVLHGVTAVQPIDPAAPAWRDVLVLTFRRA